MLTNVLRFVYPPELLRFLRPVKAARLGAIATLHTEAAAVVLSTMPQTTQKVELCLGSVFSKYAEDVHPHNHTAVWGSFWKDGRWGFACCHSLVRASYCVGAAGRRAAAAAAAVWAV